MTSRSMLLLAGVAAAAFPTAASAAATPVGVGVVVIKPVRRFETRLAHAGTHLAALRPAGYRAGVFMLAVAGGQFAFKRGGGTVANRGSLRLRHGRRIVMITHLSFTLGAASKVTAVVGGRRMTLFEVSRRQDHAIGTNMARIITGLQLRFTPAAATRVDALLGSSALAVHGAAAVATVLVEAQQNSAGASSTSAPSTSSTVSGPNSSGSGEQPSSGSTGLPGILGQLGIPSLPLPGLSNLPAPSLATIATLP